MNVTEPEMCRYVMYFASPLLCDSRELKVYPTLDEDSQYRWDLLETLRTNKLITERAYGFQLNQLFKEVGLVQRSQEPTKNSSDSRVTFDSLEECKRAYKSLLDSSKVAKTCRTEDN